jgi:hypothetical protein
MKDSEEWPSIFDTTIHEKNNPTELILDTYLIYIYCRMYIESGHFEHVLQILQF